ncbi:MAG: 3-keto-5-aminohexanoate cleavage protein, partial [Sneathiella sp.]|nr:3-keto-5-aminohexanoate cleavage protein [Sneathiella sp.]
KAIREECGDDLIIQATTEAVGIYSASQQMQMVRELQPDSASLAIKELIPEGSEAEAKEFFQEVILKKILPHYILYSDRDLLRFQELVDKGIIPESNAFLLFVLGRYSKGQTSSPKDLLPFLNVMNTGFSWSVCAFGALEHATASAAIAMGGHVRVGFENNMFLKNGDIAPNNAALVGQAVDVATAIGRSIAQANEIRELLS